MIPVATNSLGRYISQFDILASAGVGVLLTHSREPHRVNEAIYKWAMSRSPRRQYREWNIVTGWQQLGADPNQKLPAEKILDPYVALKRIDDVDGDGTGANAYRDSVLVMHYLHHVLPKHPGMIQLLKQYVLKFTTTKQRLVMVVPEGFQLPAELENDIPILDFELPLKEELLGIYRRVVDPTLKGAKTPYDENQVEELLAIGSGMTEMEFETAVSRAIIENKDRWPNVPFPDFASIISQTKTEVVKRSEVLELMQPVAIEAVGGLDNLKAWVQKRRHSFTMAAQAFGVDKPKGFVVIGPPGTGKTLVGKATAASLMLPLIKFDVSRVFNSLVGSSEARVRSALKMLDAMAPCVALIDEVDKAGLDPRQSGGDSGIGKRVMGAILTHMQESKASILWILTANRHDNLPPEMLRKGRLDEVFAVQPPNPVERMEVLRIHLKARRKDPDAITDLELAVDASKGFVSAEIEAAVKEAINDAWDGGGTAVTGKMIADQLSGMKPISVAFKNDFDSMVQWASDNARPASISIAEKEEPLTRSRSRPAPKGRTLDLNEALA